VFVRWRENREREKRYGENERTRERENERTRERGDTSSTNNVPLQVDDKER